ncbi:MAG TPA: site-specific integrase [Microvirga sp.]|nr:site-specific integrase [Microvirga sp.]
MARRPEHLQLRGSVYWLRVRVPDEVRPIIGKLEIRRSLKTSDATEAKRRVRIERLKVEAEFDEARSKLGRPRVPSNNGQAVELTEEQVWMLATRWFVTAEKKNVTRHLDAEEAEVHEADLHFIEDWDVVSQTVNTAVKELLSEAGIPDLAEHGVAAPWRGTLNRVLHQAMVESEKRLINRFSRTAHYPLDPRFTNLSAGTSLNPVSVSSVTLSELIQRYDRDPARPRSTPKTKLKQEAQFRLFKEVIGAKTLVASIDREKARKLLDVLSALPSNASKRFPKRSTQEVVRLAKERGLEPMSATTANSYMSAFTSIMDFAVAETIIKENPAKGLRRAGDGIRRKDRRHSFSTEDLARIFAAPLYTGCLNDEGGYARPGTNRPRRGRFWVPLIALFSGMRQNEICQLTEDDISTLDGTDIILIRSDEEGLKRVKTEAGKRFVPIHPELKQMGFMEHVSAIRTNHQPGTRLFPELNIASTGYYSDNFSKWFGHFLDKVGITERRKGFHSFRHTFTDALLDAEIPQNRVRELGGWSGRNTEDHYGSGTRASTLAREIAKVQYDGLDLQHLYP